MTASEIRGMVSKRLSRSRAFFPFGPSIGAFVSLVMFVSE